MSELKDRFVGLQEKTRLDSVSSTGASDWLHALPAEPQLYLDNDVFQVRLLVYPPNT